MNRIDRLVAILIHLQGKKVVTAQEIADRFGMCLRTVYRDIRALEEAGVPIGAEAGKGYFIADGYRLPPVMFTKEEASAMLMAEKMVEKLTDISVSNHFQSALYKIKSILPDREKEYLDELHSNIEVFYSRKSNSPNNYLTDLQYALAGHYAVTIDYKSFSKNELTENRTVEPVGLCFYSLGWHLIAFCRLRNEYRDFRVDRINRLTVNTETCERREILSVREYIYNLKQSTELTEVVIKVDKKTAPILQTVKYYYGFISEEESGDQVEMDFITDDLNYFGRWLLTYADAVEIVSPETLKQILRKFIISINNNLKL